LCDAGSTFIEDVNVLSHPAGWHALQPPPGSGSPWAAEATSAALLAAVRERGGGVAALAALRRGLRARTLHLVTQQCGHILLCRDAPLSCPKVVATAATHSAGSCLTLATLLAEWAPCTQLGYAWGLLQQCRQGQRISVGMPSGSRTSARTASAVGACILQHCGAAGHTGAGGWTRARPPWPPRRRASPSRARARRTLRSACCRRPARRPRRARRSRTGAPRRARNAIRPAPVQALIVWRR